MNYKLLAFVLNYLIIYKKKCFIYLFYSEYFPFIFKIYRKFFFESIINQKMKNFLNQ